MMNGINRLRKWILAFLARERVFTLLSVAAIVAGVTLAFVSLVPDIEPAGSRTASGTVPAFSTRNESFVVDAGLAEVRLETGTCVIFVTLLSPVEFADYLATGRQPAPQLDCDHRVATFTYSLRAIIIENQGSSEEPYDVSATFFAVRATRGYLALLSFPLLVGGSAVLLIRGFRRGVDRLQEEYRGKIPRK